MKFEGSEKKFEVILSPDSPSLVERGEVFWEKIVHAANASVLSKTSSDDGFAFLLSESSLFVFAHRAVMITCGETRLIDALVMLLEALDLNDVDVVVYERKNEYFPHKQATSFDGDVERLRALVPGSDLVLGNPQEHYVALYHSDKAYAPDPADSTFELLMQNIDQGVCSLFTAKPTLCGEVLQRRSRVNDILPGFEVDDHVFEPCGYSLNAIRGEYYYTLHITPESDCSYVSFETNYPLASRDLTQAASEVLKLFKPSSFALVAFEETVQAEFERLGYKMKQRQSEELGCGYTVHYLQFDRTDSNVVV